MSFSAHRSPWPVAAFATALPGEFALQVGQIALLGFTHVDLVAEIDRPAKQREALADSGLLVSCAALGRHLPSGHHLDAADVTVRRATLALLQRQLTDAAQLGATTAYLVPPPLSPPILGGDKGGDAPALSYFAEGCTLLADYAAQRMIRLCVEHVPGRVLATAAATLDWLERVGHPHLGLLLDVGHCLISGEEAPTIVQRAGARLGYVHLDDNDGANDLHWPLFQGRLTPEKLADTITALRGIGYRGNLALELNPANEDPVAALRRGKDIIEELAAGRRAIEPS